VKELIKQLEQEEGRKPSVYKDHLGFYTIGIGRLVDERKGGGLSDEEIDFLLTNDIKKKTAELLQKAPWVAALDQVRLDALIAMAFQLGVDGLLGFKTSLGLIKDGRYTEAAEQMLKSLWASQTPARAKRVAEQIRTGVRQYKY